MTAAKEQLSGKRSHVVPPEDLESGAKSIGYQPKRTTIDVDGTEVIEKIELELPDQLITWENPLKHYPLTEGQIPVADELLSLANAIIHDTEPAYGAQLGRQDQEMNIAMSESAKQSRATLNFPLTDLTETECVIHENYEEQHGHPIDDVEAGIDVFFPRQ